MKFKELLNENKYQPSDDLVKIAEECEKALYNAKILKYSALSTTIEVQMSWDKDVHMDSTRLKSLISVKGFVGLQPLSSSKIAVYIREIK